ncbi:hypothetical protein PHMEG_00037219 [Phytophthora megakarya]|uniref:Uncharacterized protein n=1 Tax=Phytophthora megakarya TaxID=4795 RepID=A0A225UK12_9STRA|nr:hypothetical protein PHMEG_00037219 [Phytophthora megakarya]
MKHLTAFEKLYIIRAHEYFLEEARNRRDPEKRAVRQRVAACLAVMEDMVKRTVTHWNQHYDESFTAGREARGCAPRSEAEQLHGIISGVINARNLFKKPILTGTIIPPRTMRKELHRMERYCIMEAGVVLVKNGKLHAEWVPDSVEFWPSPYKSTDTDYHGNFNGTLFL